MDKIKNCIKRSTNIITDSEVLDKEAKIVEGYLSYKFKGRKVNLDASYHVKGSLFRKGYDVEIGMITGKYGDYDPDKYRMVFIHDKEYAACVIVERDNTDAVINIFHGNDPKGHGNFVLQPYDHIDAINGEIHLYGQETEEPTTDHIRKISKSLAKLIDTCAPYSLDKNWWNQLTSDLQIKGEVMKQKIAQYGINR